jgi:hypothetical protein
MSSAPINGDGKLHKSVWGPLIRFVLSLDVPQTPKLLLLQLVSRATPAVPDKHPARRTVAAKRRELAKAAGVSESAVSHAANYLEKKDLLLRAWGSYGNRNSFRVYELTGKIAEALEHGVVEPPRKSFDRAASSTAGKTNTKGDPAPSSTVGVSPAAPSPCSQQHGGGAPGSNPEVPLKAPLEERDEVSQDERACALEAPRAPADGNGHGNNGTPSPAAVPGENRSHNDLRQPVLKLKSPPKEMTPQEIEERKRFLRQQAAACMKAQETARKSQETSTEKAKQLQSSRNHRRRKTHAA